MTLAELKDKWLDTQQNHHLLNEIFVFAVNKDDDLRSHRDLINKNEWGFGEKSFWWLWKLICKELPEDAKLCEIGVHKGATLSLWRLLKPKAFIFGISPLNGNDGYEERDYWKDICVVHKTFNQNPPVIIDGYSQDDWVIKGASNHSPFDVVYIDGLHTYEGCMADLVNYSQMVVKGGYLVIDDAGRYLNLPEGMYSGHEGVSGAVKDWDKEDFEFMFSLCHIVVYKRK